MKNFFCLLFVLFCVSSSALCQSGLLKPQGIYTSNFIIDEIPRNITYYTPLSYGKPEAVYPLLILLPDDKENAKSVIKKYGDFIHSKADSLGCVVMYPDAVANHWNSKTSDLKDSVNDAGFLNIMLDYFVQQYHCDADHIYLLGIGNGGAMCYRFSCESNSQPAALAVINTATETNNLPDCRIKKMVPAIRIRQAGDMKPSIEKALTFLFAQHKNQ